MTAPVASRLHAESLVLLEIAACFRSPLRGGQDADQIVLVARSGPAVFYIDNKKWYSCKVILIKDSIIIFLSKLALL